MGFGTIKKYEFYPLGGDGAAISDDPFDPIWDLDTAGGASRHALYQYLITIGAGFGNTAYVRASGNDSTAVVGNILLPFATIGAAIDALGTLTGSALAIAAGNYVCTDVDTPYGLRAPNSHYDIVCEVGVNIAYYGSYGMYCATSNESGSIYGYGNFKSYSSTASKVIDGVDDFAFNVAGVTGISTYEFQTITSEAVFGDIGLFRVGNSGGVSAAYFDVRNRAFSRTGTVITADTGSSSKWTGQGTYDAVGDFLGGTNYAVQINNPTRFDFIDSNITARGTAYGNANTKCIGINNTANGLIKFVNVGITCLQAGAGYKLITFDAVAASMDNLLFQDCQLRNRQSTSFTSAGNSFHSNFNTSFKIIDTYSEKNIGGTGVITNLITTGNGFMVEPNIV